MSSREHRTQRSSLVLRHAVMIIAAVITGMTLALAFQAWLQKPWPAVALALLVVMPLVLYLAHASFAPLLATFRALEGTVTSYRDGDFAFSLRRRANDELGDLINAHNALGATLREQRMDLVERELLLDTMLQNTPVAMVLCDAASSIVYANLAARKLLNEGRQMEGSSLDALLMSAPTALREAMARGGDGLFAVAPEEDEEQNVYHLARRAFRLNGRRHELFLLRYLTVELRRQEVQTWKKVIRVISHELNNSLGPMASLAHSGAELVRRGKYEQLEDIFAGIEERARHLDGFINGYARFAKLPAPQPQPVAWAGFVERLRSHIGFVIEGTLPDASARFDPAQLEQALLNLLHNAHESGSAAAEVRLCVRNQRDTFTIEISDRGTGMSSTVLANALLPFYSTKRGGTGLGLTLVREIAEAHGGRVAIANRDGGGVTVTLVMPL